VTFLWGYIVNTPILFLWNIHMLRSTNMAVTQICSFVCDRCNVARNGNIGNFIQKKQVNFIIIRLNL
jgi:hypothetical protein